MTLGRGSGAASQPFPSAGQAAVLVSIALAMRIVAAILFDSLLPSGPSVLGMSAIVGLGGAFAVGAAQLGAPAAPHLGLRRPTALAALAVPLFVPWVLVVSELDNYVRVLLQVVPESAADPARPSGPFWIAELLLVLVVALPVTEELFFRGLLQPGLVTRLGRARGILLVCALDALVVLPPLEPRTMLFAAALALPLALLRQASGSLWLGLALHMCFGVVSAAAELSMLGIPGFDDMTAAHTPGSWVAPATLSAIAGFAVCYASFRRSRV